MTKLFYITYTGEKVYPNDLASLSINLIDIAHHLTNTQRFGGALPFDIKYNVAEHSIYMTQYALRLYSTDVARMCLLHDASEAYLSDVVSPLKRVLGDYKELERSMEFWIYHKYAVDTSKVAPIVAEIDRRILLDEVWNLLPDRYSMFMTKGNEPLGIHIEPNRPEEEIEQQFLNLCEQLGIGD